MANFCTNWGGHNHLVISKITEFCRGFRKEFRGFLHAC